jgi:hypothetical protein
MPEKAGSIAYLEGVRCLWIIVDTTTLDESM